MFLMLGKVPITSIVDSLKLFPAKWRVVLYIPSVFCIMCTLPFLVLTEPQLTFGHPKRQIPHQSFVFPKFVPFLRLPFFGLYIKLQFHLFKFPRSKSKVAGRYFIPESFANLGNTKRNLNPC